jgi:hypothetical protein
LQPEAVALRATWRRFFSAELSAEAALPHPKRLTIWTTAPAKNAAIEEWKTNVEHFIAWANFARKGETSSLAAFQCDQALTAFSEGRFDAPFADLSVVAVTAGMSILSHVRDSHWHLRLCPFCNRWLLAKDQRKKLCRRPECVRAVKTPQRDRQRADRRVLDRGGIARARRRTF